MPPPADARALFREVVGDDRPVTETAATTEVLELCGYLPLAVRIAGSRLRHRQAWTVSHLAARLRERRRLDELRIHDDSVAAAFKLSYDHLAPDHKTLFCLLGHESGDDIEPHATGTLIERTPVQAETMLENLVDVHLLQQSVPGRYRFHDLMRSYAARLFRDLSLGMTETRIANTSPQPNTQNTAGLSNSVTETAPKASKPAQK